MAHIRISPEALALATARIDREAMDRPILSVGWYKGQHQNSRGEDGEVVWKTVGQPHWYASLSDWAEHEAMDEHIEAGLEKCCEMIDGLKVFAAGEAKTVPGSLVVRVKNNAFILEHSDA